MLAFKDKGGLQIQRIAQEFLCNNEKGFFQLNWDNGYTNVYLG